MKILIQESKWPKDGWIVSSGHHFLEMPMKVPCLSNWNRMLSAVPDILAFLVSALERDDGG